MKKIMFVLVGVVLFAGGCTDYCEYDPSCESWDSSPIVTPEPDVESIKADVNDWLDNFKNNNLW